MPDVAPFLTLAYSIAVVLVLALLAYALIVGVARVLHRFMPATTPPRDPALDVLRTRLAKGEIDDVEFERLRSVMRIY
jgi:uncharacterized membrane protein